MYRESEATVHELEAMIEELQNYLLDDRLYRTITVSTATGERLIKMTLGGMMERIEEVEARGTVGEAIQVVERAKQELERARGAWSDRFYRMLAREAKSYTDSWNWFLQNCWEGERRCRTDYPQEVKIRLRLERLLEAGEGRPELAESRQRIQTLDEKLRQIWQEGPECIIDNCEGYPRERYWWLYGHPEPSPIA